MCAAAAMPKMMVSRTIRGSPFSPGSLHGVGYSNAGIDPAKDAEGGKHIWIGCDTGLEDGRREAIESECRVSAQIAVEAPRDPPDASAKGAAGEEEWQAQEEQDVGHLMAELPGAELAARLLNDAIFGAAKKVESAVDEEVESERKSGEAVGENAVVNVAAGGVVAGEGRRPFPGFAAATRVLIVAIGQRLAAYDPESLEEKSCQQCRRDALREIEAKAAKHTEAMGHQVQRNLNSLNGATGGAGLRTADHAKRQRPGCAERRNKKAAPKGGSHEGCEWFS